MTDTEFELIDSYDNAKQFKNISDFELWAQCEHDAWLWVLESPHKHVDLGGTFPNVQKTILNWVAEVKSATMHMDDFRKNLRAVYRVNPPQAVFSDTWPGIAVQQIKESIGYSDAELALGWLVGRGHPNVVDAQQFRLWQAVANPVNIPGQAWLEEQRTKISSARQMARRTLDQQKTEYQSEIDNLKAFVLRDRKRISRIAVKVLKGGARRASAVQHSAKIEVELIQDTRAAFQEQMRLKAPVEYWAEKRIQHNQSSQDWLKALGVFVVIAAIAVGLAFNAALSSVGNQALSGRHILILAGMGTLLTFAFWMAKLIVRIYLGERHLATDAEERRVMTQAYLALINESAASSDERVVILSSLFKTAQDGIVRDDNSADFSLPAILASALAGRTTKP